MMTTIQLNLRVIESEKMIGHQVFCHFFTQVFQYRFFKNLIFYYILILKTLPDFF